MKKYSSYFLLMILLFPTMIFAQLKASNTCELLNGAESHCSLVLPKNIEFFNLLRSNPPKEYLKMENSLNNFLSKVCHDILIVESLTDNMVSYQTLLISNLNIGNDFNNNRISTLCVSERQFQLLKELMSFLCERNVKFINLYKVFNRPSASPIRYTIIRTAEGCFTFIGAELLKEQNFKNIKDSQSESFNSIFVLEAILNYIKRSDIPKIEEVISGEL